MRDRPEAAPNRAAEDRRLLQAVARGDRGAFSELYDRFATPVFSMIANALGDKTEAEDIAQEDFLVVWRQAPEFDPARGSAYCWVVTIARRRAIDRWRTRQRHSMLTEKWGGLDSAEHVPPDCVSMTTDDASIVRSALTTLCPRDRKVLELVFFSGLTHVEVAGRLQLPLGTAKSSLRRALHRLRDQLGICALSFL